MRTHGMCALGDAIQVPWKEQIDLRPYGEAFPPLSTHARSSMEDGPFMEDGGSQSVPSPKGRNSWKIWKELLVLQESSWSSSSPGSISAIAME